MKVSLSDLRDLTHKAVLGYGYTVEETKIIEEVLLFAQLRDSNQGIVKLIGKGIPKDSGLVVLGHGCQRRGLSIAIGVFTCSHR